jgi:5-methyltetrahydrofolate--homocysteine methyltransferase
MGVLEEIYQNVIEGNIDQTKKLTQQALDEGFNLKEILNKGLTAAMDVVGEQFGKGEKFIPEMLISAQATKGAMEILAPFLTGSGIEPKGKVVIGTVKGDLHDIGMNLVAMMLEGAGFQVHTLEADVPAEDFIRAAKNDRAHIVGMSALLTTTMPYMSEVIKVLNKIGLRKKVKVMVGGAPLTQ